MGSSQLYSTQHLLKLELQRLHTALGEKSLLREYTIHLTERPLWW